MANEVREGGIREVIVDGMELDPADGATATIRLSGRSGAVKISGNGTHYKESNPHAGYISQDVSSTVDQFKRLTDIQTAGRFVSVTATTAGNEILDGNMAISNDDGLERDNGVVSLELSGRLRPR
jgi:hypothetical protein